jgi:hypothetical protein
VDARLSPFKLRFFSRPESYARRVVPSNFNDGTTQTARGLPYGPGQPARTIVIVIVTNAAADYASSRFIITDSDGGPILGAGLVAQDDGFIVDSEIRRGLN